MDSKERDLQVYIISAEIKALEGSEMWGQAIGGFVYCYIKAFDALEAAAKVADALEEDKYDIVAFEWIMPVADMSWEDDDQAAEQSGYADEAEQTGDVVYSAFTTYETEYEH